MTFVWVTLRILLLSFVATACPTCLHELCTSYGTCLYGCKTGYWGEKCLNECTDQGCQPDADCYRDRVLINGKKTYECTLCPDGYYRGNTLETLNCSAKCPNNCKSCSSFISVLCHECKAPYYNDFETDNCSKRCPEKCKACLSATKCTKCMPPYSNDYNITNCSILSCPENCATCAGEQCSSCAKGFFNITANCQNICPYNCVSCSSTEKCEQCMYGYYNGYEIDNPDNVLAENCRWTCRQNCSECTRYNNCQKCVNGTFGSVCENQCSIGCKFDACDKETGSCDCTLSFSGDKCCVRSPFCQLCSSPTECAKCEEGHHGELCQHNCSTSCLGGCEMASGQCHSCATNTYGRFCDHYCSSGCLDDSLGRSLCNTSNGICLYGCKPGYFGANCGQHCSGTCLNGCDTKSGLCRGCMTNLYGLFCNNSCSENCFNDAEGATKCNATDGSCLQGCKSGYYGEMCTSPCSKYCVGRICDWFTGKCLLGCTDDVQNGPMCNKSALNPEQTNDNNCVQQTSVAVGITFALTTVFTTAVILLSLRYKSWLKTLCTQRSGVTEDVNEIKSDACETYETLQVDRTISNVDYDILEAKGTKRNRNTKV